MRKSLPLLIALLFTCITFSSSVLADEIAIPGTGDGVAVLNSIGEEFTQKTGVVVLVPKSIGSGGGVKAVGNDHVNLGRVARGIKDKEKHFGLSYKAFFTVPTVFFAHQSVSIDDIGAQQVLDIFSGKITNWKEVGGSDNAIVVIRREDGDSSWGNLQKTFPGFKDITITENATKAPKTPVMVAQVQNREHSIGFGPYDVAVANNLKVLKVNGKGATDKGYPYFGTIGFVYKDKNLTGITKDFVEFAVSPNAHDAIKKAGGSPIEN
jgi:phosphate transport system substrate-binding protein